MSAANRIVRGHHSQASCAGDALRRCATHDILQPLLLLVMLMLFTFTKRNGKYDRMSIVRDDGSCEEVDCAKQRIIPHEMVHFAVESTLRKRGFMTRIRDGEAAAMRMAATAESDGVERLVEVVQGDAWSGGSTPVAEMLELYVVTCRERACPPLAVSSDDMAAVRSRIEEFDRQWQALAVGASITLEM